MTTMTAKRNTSACTACYKAGTTKCKPETCKLCQSHLPPQKQGVEREQDLLQELTDKRRVSKGFMLLNLSETATGEYTL